MRTQNTIGIALLFCALLLVMILAGCETRGTGTSPSSAPPAVAQTPPTSVPGTGHTVQVTLSAFKIVSSVKIFHAGNPYHFVVTNAGALDHELMITPKGLDVASMSLDQVEKQVLFVIDDVAQR